MEAWLFRLRLIAIFAVAALTLTISPGSAAPTGVVYFDLVVDEARQVLYGSDQMGNKIDVLSMSTLEVVSTILVGSQPTGIDIDPNGNELAVALFGQGQIAFIDLNTLAVIDRVYPNVDYGGKPYEVLYGRPGRLYSVGNSDSIDYLHVFDTYTKVELSRSEEVIRFSPRFAMTADQNTLYVSEWAYKIYRFDITTDMPIQTASTPFGQFAGLAICVTIDGKLVTSFNQVWSADLSTILGSSYITGIDIECSKSDQKVYISEVDSIIHAFDTSSYQSLWSLDYRNETGVARLDNAEDYLYTSTSSGIKVLGTSYKQQAYMPLMSSHSPSIHGYVTIFGNRAVNIPLELRFFDGSVWSTRATSTTDSDGFYAFFNVPSLETGQKYYVRYMNYTDPPMYLLTWNTRELTAYSMGNPVNIGNFDIGTVYLSKPIDGATVTLPYSFIWTTRQSSPTDVYEINLYDYLDFNPYFFAEVGYSGNYTLNSLPTGFEPNKWYVWEIWIYSPDGGFGISYESSLVLFRNSGLQSAEPQPPLLAKPARNLDDLPNR